MQFGPPRLRTSSVCLSTHAVSEILASCLALSKQAVSACMAAEAPQPKYKPMFGSTATCASYVIASPTPPASTALHNEGDQAAVEAGGLGRIVLSSHVRRHVVQRVLPALTYLTVVSGAATAI